MTLNPFKAYFNYIKARDLRIERQQELDRMERQDMLQTMSTMAERAFESSRMQSEVLKTFLDGFNTTDRPRMREYDEEAESQRYRARRQVDTPTELLGLDKLEQFERLLDRLDE